MHPWLVFELLKNSTIQYGNLSNLLYFIQFYFSKMHPGCCIQLLFIDFHSFLIFHLMYISQLYIYTFISCWCFPPMFAIKNNVGYSNKYLFDIHLTSMFTCSGLGFFIGYILRKEIPGSRVCIYITSKIQCRIAFHNGCTNSNSHQLCTSIAAAPYPCQHFLTFSFYGEL